MIIEKNIEAKQDIRQSRKTANEEHIIIRILSLKKEKDMFIYTRRQREKRDYIFTVMSYTYECIKHFSFKIKNKCFCLKTDRLYTRTENASFEIIEKEDNEDDQFVKEL